MKRHSADQIASIYVMHPIIRMKLRRMSPGLPILMYHSISADTESAVRPYYRVATSPKRFREQMQWLRDNRYKVVSLREALNRASSSETGSDRVVVITFDDGYWDFLTNAFPILSEFGYTASVYLPTDYIGDITRREFAGRPCLTWNEVRRLRAENVVFGAHTVTHPVLHRMHWTDVARELRGSRMRIEQELGEPIQAFAYPFAFPQEDRPFVRRLRDELVTSGFETALTTVIGRVRYTADNFFVARLPINDTDSCDLFAAKLEGAYDWMASVQWLNRARKRWTR